MRTLQEWCWMVFTSAATVSCALSGFRFDWKLVVLFRAI